MKNKGALFFAGGVILLAAGFALLTGILVENIGAEVRSAMDAGTLTDGNKMKIYVPFIALGIMAAVSVFSCFIIAMREQALGEKYEEERVRELSATSKILNKAERKDA